MPIAPTSTISTARTRKKNQRKSVPLSPSTFGPRLFDFGPTAESASHQIRDSDPRGLRIVKAPRPKVSHTDPHHSDPHPTPPKPEPLRPKIVEKNWRASPSGAQRIVKRPRSKGPTPTTPPTVPDSPPPPRKKKSREFPPRGLRLKGLPRSQGTRPRPTPHRPTPHQRTPHHPTRHHHHHPQQQQQQQQQQQRRSGAPRVFTRVGLHNVPKWYSPCSHGPASYRVPECPLRRGRRKCRAVSPGISRSVHILPERLALKSCRKDLSV